MEQDKKIKLEPESNQLSGSIGVPLIETQVGNTALEAGEIINQTSENTNLYISSSKINQETCIKQLYELGFAEANHSLSNEELVEQINIGKFSTIERFINKKIQKIQTGATSDIENAFEMAQDFPEIIKIINLLLIPSLKINYKLEEKYKFIDFLIQKYNYISDIINENFRKCDCFIDFTTFFLLERLKFIRNCSIITNFEGVKTEDDIYLESNKAKKLIGETVGAISQITDKIGLIEEHDDNKNTGILLSSIIIINKYSKLIENGINLSEVEEIEYIGALRNIIENNKDISLRYIDGIVTALEYELEGTKKIAHIDELTQIRNRRSHDTHLKSLIGELYRQHLNSTINTNNDIKKHYYIFFDIDHFKNFNDRFGHAGGDQILYKIAKGIENLIRDGDLLFRWGGEEFAVITHQMGSSGAMLFAEKIRKYVEDNLIYIDENGRNHNITISIGVSEINIDDDKESLIKGGIEKGMKKKRADIIKEKADIALYQIKDNGRNQVSINMEGGKPEIVTQEKIEELKKNYL